MIRLFRHRNTPGALWALTVLGCGLFFCMALWQHNALPEARANGLQTPVGMGVYKGLGEQAPSFLVKADVVHVMRVIPVAGRALRSPCVDMEGDLKELGLLPPQNTLLGEL